MYELAKVTSIGDDGKISVMCDLDACAGCKGSAFCATKGKIFEADNKHGLALGIGDNVELFLPPGKTIFSGFISLIFPLMLFPLGYYAPLLFSGEPTEKVKILCGVAAIALSFPIIKLYSNQKGKKLLPIITRVIGEKGN